MHFESVMRTKREMGIWNLQRSRRARHGGTSALKKVVSELDSILVHVSLLALALVPFTRPLWAQGDSSIAGAVRDASGAGIAAATVHIKNLETGTERHSRSGIARNAGSFGTSGIMGRSASATIRMLGFGQQFSLLASM
jgi:hypothetical protein